MTQKVDLKNLDKSKWRSCRFDEIASKISETVDPNATTLETYVGLEHLDAEDIHIRRFGTPDDVSGGKLRCYPGDVIFGKRRAYQRKAAIVDFDGICSAHAFVFRANPEVIDPQLFPFFLHSDQFMHRMVDISVGGLSPTINWGDLKHQEFLLPPKDQQAQLAKLLWAMDEVIQMERVVAKRTQSLLAATRRNLNKGELKEYTGEQLTNLITKGASPNWQGFDYCNEGTLFITSENVLEDSIDLKDKKYLPLSFHEKQKRSQLKKGDILINIVGASIGRLAIFNEEIEHANINQAVCLFRVNKKALAEYLVQYMLDDSNKNRLLNNQSATARPNLSLKNLNDYKFYLPVIEIQKERIVEITKVKAALSRIQNSISHSISLQKSLINQIF